MKIYNKIINIPKGLSQEIECDCHEEYNSGYTAGLEEGYDKGYDSGYTDGAESVDCEDFYKSGYTSGYTDGAESVDCEDFYNSGYTAGLEKGNEDLIANLQDDYFVIPEGTTKIRDYAFHATSLSAITIPSSVTFIGKHAFQGCKNLTEIVIPDSVKTLGTAEVSADITYPTAVFRDCTQLTAATLPSGLTVISNYLFAYTSLTGITLPTGITTIGYGAFQNCKLTGDIVIPSGVTLICGGAFDGCSGLTSMTFESPVPATRAYLGSYDYTWPIYVPCEAVEDYKTAWPRYAHRIMCKSGDTPSVEKYVADLVDEGYANFVQSGGTYKGGNYVEILSSCPYDMSQIVDLEDVALNQKQLSGIQNTIVWNQVLPSGWNAEDIAAIYSGQTLNYTPRGEQFWAITSAISSFTITYTGDSYVTNDYPWGSFNSEGVFAPRFNAYKQPQYAANGWLSTPESVTVNFTSSFSSVAQVMFTQMMGTRTLTINQLAGTFACHDVTGMFEANTNMETLNINGNFNWGTWRTCHNVFDACMSLTGIPFCSSWSRTHANNTIYPHYDGARGSANCRHIFNNALVLRYLGPVFNMGAISLSGCTYDGQNQDALSDTLFNCPVLEDVLIKNLNNNDWNFTNNSTFTYIPSMNVASIEYLLNNVEDVTADPHTITFSTLHQGEISQSAIDNATSKGWTIAYA